MPEPEGWEKPGLLRRQWPGFVVGGLTAVLILCGIAAVLWSSHR